MDIAPFVSEIGLTESGQPWTMTIQRDGSGGFCVYTVTARGSDDSGMQISYSGSLTTSVDLSNTLSR